MHGQKNIKTRITVGHVSLNKQNYLYVSPIFWHTSCCKLASKQVVLFCSASNLLPACGVQSVQRTEWNSANKLCLKSSAE